MVPLATAARRLVVATLVAVAAAACAPDGGLEPPLDVLPGDPVEEQADGGTADAPGDASEDDGASPATPGPAQPEAAPEQGGGDGGEVAAPPADQPSEEPVAPRPAPALTAASEHGPTGSNGPAYLRGDRPRLVLEVDLQDGAPYDTAAIDHAAAVLARESNAEVVVSRGAATSTRRDDWTVGQLAAAAAATRDATIDDTTMVLHLLVLRGGFEKDGVLGLAFDATTAVVFPERWQDLSTLLVSDAGIARAVTLHEVGHLLGLVGLATEPTSDHEDPDHPGHTTDEDDVMFHAVETTLIANLAGGPPSDFGPRTRADLAAMRQG